MASTNDFDKTMSLYIPRVDTRSLPRGNCHEEAEYEAMVADFIGKQFKYQCIGQVNRVDLLKKQTPQGFDFFIAFVHFSEWFETPQAKALQDEIHTDGAKAKFYFHEMWYWIVNENKNPLTAIEASLHKTIYEQAKHIGMLNEAVDYLKSMKNVTSEVAQAALQRTAEVGFGANWIDIMASPPPCSASLVAPEFTWNSVEDFPLLPYQCGSLQQPPTTENEVREIPPPPPLMRSVADGGFRAIVSPAQPPPRPPPLARTQSTATVSPAQPPPRPPPLARTQSTATVSPAQPPPRPPPLARTQSTATGYIHLTPRDLFGPNAAYHW